MARYRVIYTDDRVTHMREFIRSTHAQARRHANSLFRAATQGPQILQILESGRWRNLEG